MKQLVIPYTFKCLKAYEHFNNTRKNILLTFFDEESTLKAYKQLQFIANKVDKDNILFFPSLDTLPYDRISPNQEILSTRANVLTTLAMNISAKLVVTTAQNLIIKTPPPITFINSAITIKPGDKFLIEDLVYFLINNGFTRVPNAIESGEFAIRGEIVDLIKSDNEAYRINFGWEVIESIKQFDVNSQISIKPIGRLEISAASEATLTIKTIEIFRINFLKNFGVNHIQSNIYESIISGLKFQGYEHLLPLFYEEMSSLQDYMGDHTVMYDNLSMQSILESENSYNDFYEARILSNKANPDSFYFALPPSMHIISSDEIKSSLENSDNLFLKYDQQSNKPEETKNLNSDLQAQMLHYSHGKKDQFTVVFCNSKSSLHRITTIAKNNELTTLEISNLELAKKHLINLALAPLSNSFSNDKYIFISDQDILGKKFTSEGHKSTRRKLKNILTELDNIEEGEFVVHKDHGIGRFEKIETIVVDEVPHDCLKITYFNNDLLYLPVENINLITKYGNNDDTILDKLGGVNWQRRKAHLKNRIKDIAAELIKTTAARHLHKTRPVNFDPEEYLNFCNRFIYSETDDQLSAISDIESDLKSGNLMDRLICGDVGFGKTEVAMRAAFMTVFDMDDDQPQVAIISPTTILCRQHYMSFMERFNSVILKDSKKSGALDHSYKIRSLIINQLSRLVTPAKAREIKLDLANGKINIIVGTHALLSKQVKFKNLKLIIIDEEQHFGVTQKEHLKTLKADTHVLSLSATPIPRTLQMSMSGLKDLSIIATAPIDRLPVRTTVMPFDGVIIRDALMRERFRGGKSFYVAPRIKDIEWIAKKLTQYVPELKFKIAHGQMPPSELDKIMNEFCDGGFDILLSTTIIESGIDIASANTIIIHRADMLGLSQLYQLRGRVGRGKVRGYAYLTLLSDKLTTKHSWQRLEILQNIDSLGAGFTIATHDMDLRGFGNLVGDQQSGHIREVGCQLYQEMLDEAILELQNDKTQTSDIDFTPSINLGTPVYIPSNYIEDSSLRIAIYRRAGDLKTHTEIEKFEDEMIDRFGPIPNEFRNLLNIVAIKNKCFSLKIESLDAGPAGFVVKFNKNFDVSAMVMSFVNNFPRHAKIKPDNKLVFIKDLTCVDILEEAQKLLYSLAAPTK